MKIAYLDCPSGASGDMVLGALIDAGVDVASIQDGIDSLGLTQCRLVTEAVKRCGFRANKVSIEHPPEHAHRHLHHITDMIDRSRLTEQQKQLATNVFTRLGEAEAKVHGTTVQKVHFHEVGAVDSIADIVGSAIGLDQLQVDQFVCSPLPTGHGFVQIAHGRCSIPAPATAELLQGVPLVDCPVEAELTTPTGAAIISSVASRFGSLPNMVIERIGYGAGDMDFPTQPNILRLLVGHDDAGTTADQVVVVETNLDDVTGEVIGHCMSRLLEAGALDVYTMPIQMKKDRPAVKVTVLCSPAGVSQIEGVLFRETGTLGIRRWTAQRHTLKRAIEQVETPWGTVRGKVVQLDGKRQFSPEYEDCRALASAAGVPLRQVQQAARQAFTP